MNPSARWSIVLLVLLLAIVNISLRPDTRAYTPTSFGTTPSGYGAVFTLLAELKLPVARSYGAPNRIPATATVWWIEPRGVCAEEATSAEGARWPGIEWIRGGGTAVVFLSPIAESPAQCRFIGDAELPPREARDVPTMEPAQGDPGEAAPPRAPPGKVVRLLGRSLFVDNGRPPNNLTTNNLPEGSARFSGKDAFSLGWALPTSRGSEPPTSASRYHVAGPLVPAERIVEMPASTNFADAASWAVLATLDGRPFVLERALGEGRLVVAADASFLRNQWLDHVDAAPLAVDFVRAVGVPLFDERSHGFGMERNPLRYLVASPALPVFLGLAMIGVLVAWRGHAMPPRIIAPAGEHAPALDAFVDSVAVLFARTRDYRRVLERYRELTAARLRRYFGLPPETSVEALVDLLRRQGRVRKEALQRLSEASAPADERELRAAAGALDQLVKEASQ